MHRGWAQPACLSLHRIEWARSLPPAPNAGGPPSRDQREFEEGMTTNTITHRHAVSILLLLGTILLVVAAWKPDNEAE
jgi:hypothetical protein